MRAGLSPKARADGKQAQRGPQTRPAQTRQPASKSPKSAEAEVKQPAARIGEGLTQGQEPDSGAIEPLMSPSDTQVTPTPNFPRHDAASGAGFDSAPADFSQQRKLEQPRALQERAVANRKMAAGRLTGKEQAKRSQPLIDVDHSFELVADLKKQLDWQERQAAGKPRDNSNNSGASAKGNFAASPGRDAQKSKRAGRNSGDAQ